MKVASRSVGWATLIGLAAASCSSNDGAGGPGGGAPDGSSGHGGASGGSGGAAVGGDGSTPGGEGGVMFRVLDPVADQAPRNTDTPTEFIRRTLLFGASRAVSVVVGNSQLLHIAEGGSAEGDESFRWTEATGVVGLGFDPSLNMSDKHFLQSWTKLMSDDGSVVILESGSSTSRPFRWTQSSGLAALTAVTGADSVRISAMNADGSVVVGVASIPPAATSHDEAVRWTPSGVVRLGMLPGHTDSRASGVSADGSVVVVFRHR